MDNFDIGTQVSFDYKLQNWRQSLSTNSIDKKTSKSTTLDCRSSPYSRPSSSRSTDNNSNTCEVTLSEILNNSKKGKCLVDYFEEHKKFNENQRNALITVISFYLADNNINLSLKDSYRFEKEIISRFPTEKIEYYRSSRRGKLYNKYSNTKKTFNKVVPTITSVKQQPVIKERLGKYRFSSMCFNLKDFSLLIKIDKI